MMNKTLTLADEILNDQNTWLAMKILMFGITPAISIFGVVGNVLSIVVLVKHGMSKCSNILLVTLAFCDIIFLISFNSVPKIIYEAVWNREYFGYSKSACEALFVLFTFFTALDYSIGLMSLMLPMFITAERLVVIFFPFHSSRILTPTKTWVTIIGVAVYWLSLCVYISFWQDFECAFDPIRNTSLGLIKRSIYFINNRSSIAIFQEVFLYACIYTPPIFTLIGCIAIFIQIQITSIKRKKMTSAVRSTSRTTKTLLAVCAVYLVTATLLAIPMYISEEYASYSLTDDNPTNIGRLFYQLMNTVSCINSSCNFIIYVGVNKQFRGTLIKLLQVCCERLQPRPDLLTKTFSKSKIV
ncbi:neuropeptides capa receptor [Biomphalaria glabrata]|nr:neuropeptides capa receptor-like [Biomphalaria glabrata]